MLSPRHFAIIALVVVLPIVLFGIGIVLFLGADSRSDLNDRIAVVAQQAAADVDRQVSRDIAILSVLAASSALDYGDRGDFRRELRRALDANHVWRVLALQDPNGPILEEHVPGAEVAVPFLKGDMVREVLRTGAPHIAGPIGGLRTDEGPFLTIHVPVLHDSLPRLGLTLVQPAHGFVASMNRYISRQVPRVMLVDGNGRVLACASVPPDCGGIVGSTFDDLDGNARALPARGAFNPRIGGEEHIAMQASAPLTGWRVVAGMPRAAESVRFRSTRSAILLGGLAVGLIGFAAAALLAQALLGRNAAERRLAALETERESERRLTGMARSLPGLAFRRVRYPDGWVHLRCLIDADNVFRLPAGAGGDESAAAEALQRMMVPDTARRWEEAFGRTAASLTPLQMEGELIDPTGRLRRFRANAGVRKRADGSVIWDGVMLDITDLHEAEIARRLSADQLAFALEYADAGIWEWDIVSNRCVWSDSLWRLMGYAGPEGEPTLEKIEQRLHPDDVDVYWAGIDNVLMTGAGYTREYRFIQPDGSVRWITSRARTTIDRNGLPVRITGLDIDITRLKRVQDELRAAKDAAERADVAKSRFLAAASHDLRQPVQSLMLFVHLLRQRLAGHRDEPLVGNVQQALDVLKDLLDSILDLSRLDAGVIEAHPVPVPAAQVLTRIASEYAPRFAAKGLALRVLPSRALIDTDPLLLGRILGNLVENALKYTEVGGVFVGARRRGGRLRFEVWDSGIGIPPDRIEEIFGEFVQLDNPERDRTRGLGLGLAIVRRLTALLDYPLEVRSRPGRGSMFSVSVPLSAAAPAPAAEPEAPLPAPSALSAVVIDDEPIILEGLRTMLEDWGCAVVAAPDLGAALLGVELAGLRPAILIADFRLRQGQTGLDAITAFRERYGAALPAILLSGDTQVVAPDQHEGLRFARKPVAPAQLKRMLDELAGQAVTNSAAR